MPICFRTGRFPRCNSLLRKIPQCSLRKTFVHPFNSLSVNSPCTRSTNILLPSPILTKLPVSCPLHSLPYAQHFVRPLTMPKHTPLVFPNASSATFNLSKISRFSPTLRLSKFLFANPQIHLTNRSISSCSNPSQNQPPNCFRPPPLPVYSPPFAALSLALQVHCQSSSNPQLRTNFIRQ